MKAVVLKSFRSPLNVVDWKDIEDVGGNDVLVKIEMTGVCYRDILTVDGFFPKTRLPIILGHEIYGKIVEVGEDVVEFKKGDRVSGLTYTFCGVCVDCLNGRENICRNRLWFGEDLNGSYAEYMKIDKKSLVKTPEDVSPEAAAISACVTGMLIHALKNVGRVKEGESILVTGASGGVGVHAIQLAKTLGLEVIAVTGREENIDKLYKLGADHVILSRDNIFSNQVKNITGGIGVDVVLECVGLTFTESLKSIKWGGRIIDIGNIKPEPIPFTLGHIILREVSIHGSISCTKKELQEALEIHRSGKVKPITTTLPLEQVEEAHKLIRERKHFGRITLKP
ncbi:MAG: alcohol dehydrogenase catalytic domain-containing protein [Nitrososphaerota archaeon]|nr:alcohol dehydrogenase catalytic domain-containing protein [Candidatus Geocrenenecus dongiae]